MSDFLEFPKIGRLSRDVIVTEKIDGTNAQVCIVRPDDTSAVGPLARLAVGVNTDTGLIMLAGSRTQYITPERDNHGFARWVQTHAQELFALGEGRHYGEWWGSGIQRGYGLQKGEKRWSLFNVGRWSDDRDRDKFPTDRPGCCGVVPVLYRGPFDTLIIDGLIQTMRVQGSIVAPGFMKPEGVVVFHSPTGTLFKKTVEKDEQPKSLVVA